jgi:hypothetical protein
MAERGGRSESTVGRRWGVGGDHPWLALVVAVLLAQAAFWGMTALLHPPAPPYPMVRLTVTGEGHYRDARWPQPFTLVTTDHVTVSLTVTPPRPVGLTLRAWDETGRLLPGRAVSAMSGQAVGPLTPGRNPLVAEGPPGHFATAPVWYLPRDAPDDFSHITRTVAITLTPERIQALYTVQFGPGAPREELIALLTGESPPGLFLKRLFYATQEGFTAAEWTTVRPPHLTAEGGLYQVEIAASSDEPFYNPSRLPILLAISPAPTGEDNGITLLRLVAAGGAQLQTCQFPPDSTAAGVWTWALEPGEAPPRVRCHFGAQIDPTRSPIAWGRYQWTRLLQTVWAWRGLGWLVVWSLPPLTPWLYGALAVLPLLIIRRIVQGPVVRRLTTAGVGLAFGVACAGLSAWAASLWLPGLSGAGLLWAGGLASLGVLFLTCYEPPPAWRWPLMTAWPLLIGASLGALTRPGEWTSGVTLVYRAATPPPGGWTSGLVISLFSAPLLAFIWWLSRRAWQERGATSSRSKRWWAFLLAAVFLLLLALPTAADPVDFSPVAGAWSLNPGRELTLLTVWVGLPYVALTLLAALLQRHDELPAEGTAQVAAAASLAAAVSLLQAAEKENPAGQQRLEEVARRERERRALALLTLLLAAFAAGLLRQPLTTYAALLPVAPLLAWGGFRLLLRPPVERDLPSALRVLLAVPRWRRELTRTALTLLADGRTQEEQDAAQEALHPLLEGGQRRISMADVVFAADGGESGWTRGLVALRRALLLLIPLGVFFAPALASAIAARSATAFGPLEVLSVFLVPFGLRWLLPAFVLGYGFPYLRGHNGWEKGLFLGLVIALANLAQDTILYARSTQDVLGLLVEGGLTILVLSIVGVWAFDWRRVAEAGGRFSHLRTLYGLSTLTGYLTSLLPPVAAIVTEGVQGRLTSLLRAFVEMVLPNISRF